VTVAILIAGLLAALVVSGIFSGGETGLYSLSRWRVEADAQRGSRSARIVRRLLRDEAGLLATILIGNNLANELGIHFGRGLIDAYDLSETSAAIVTALLLTPLFFFFGELLPKDLHRRRPHALVGFTAPLIGLSKALFLPISLPLRALSKAFERRLGLRGETLATGRGRRAVLDLMRASAVEPVAPHMEQLASNVLELRRRTLAEVLVPWRQVVVLHADADPAESRRLVRESRFTRLPLVEASGRVHGYVHQLDVLAAGPDAGIEEHLRELLVLPSSLALDRALVRLRAAGARAALVGEPGAPEGLVTLKDLVEEISGELARW